MKSSRRCLTWFVYLLVVGSLFGALKLHAQTALQLYTQGVQAYEQGDMAQAKQKLQLTLEVDKNFRPASALLSRISAEQQAAGVANPAVMLPAKSLAHLALPVEFKDTSLQSALEYLRQRIKSATGGKTQVNFVLNLPPELANRKVTLQLAHVPVTEVLRYLGDMAGVNFQIQKYAILVTPASAPEPASATPLP